MSDAPGTDPVEALVRRAQGGDATSFAGLYERFHDKIFRYVYFKTGNPNDAEDITEDVFLRMLGSINSLAKSKHTSAGIIPARAKSTSTQRSAGSGVLTRATP